jgi:hypothetical protein
MPATYDLSGIVTLRNVFDQMQRDQRGAGSAWGPNIPHR